LLLGPRKGKYGREGQVNPILGANLPLSTLGTFMLWLGWFGFNGGSLFEITTIEKANSLAQVFVNTNLAGASGVISALLMSRVLFGKADLTMVLNGALAGLVAITASPATPTPVVAAVIGAVGGVLVVFAILSLDKYKIDDPVGAISAHGVSGFWGLLAVPLSNEAASFMRQLLGAATIFIWVFATSFLVWWLLKITMGIRVNEEDEYEGVDLSECGLEAYPEFVTPK
ncbi:MAG: ammonium transporter, partial [Pseudomonadota bacterium]|nr:ammonium transporter [Pseudomonadota bacterium]